MNLDEQIQGLSATIVPADYSDALCQDDYVDAYVNNAVDQRDVNHDQAALEHLLTSIDTMLKCRSNMSQSVLSVIAQPTTISAESIGENLIQSVKSFIESAIRICKDMITRLVNWAKNLKALLPNVLKSIAKAREQVDNLPSTTPNPTHKNPAGLGVVAINNRIPRSGHELTTGLKTVVKLAAVIYGDYAKEVLALEQKLLAVLNKDFGDGSGEEHLQAVNKEMVLNRLLVKYSFAHTTEDNGLKVSETDPMLGSKKLVYTWPSPDVVKELNVSHETSAPFEIAKLMQKSNVRLESTVSDNVKLVPDAKLFKTLTKNEMVELLDISAALVDIYNGYTDDTQKKLQAQIESSQSYLSNMEMLKDKPAVVDGSIAMSDAKYLRSIVAYHSAIAKWAAEPFQQFANYVIDLVNAVLRIVRESVAQYA